MVAIASDSSGMDGLNGYSDGYGADAAATTPLPLEGAQIRRAVKAAKAPEPLTREAQSVTPVAPHATWRHARLSAQGRQTRNTALRVERRLASHHAPRWYERLALWLLRAPLTMRRDWWDTPTIMAARLLDRSVLRQALAREKARVWKLTRQIMRRDARAAGWPQDANLWRLQVAELLAAAGVRVEVETDRWGGRNYETRPLTAPLGDATNPTLDAVLDGHVARDRDQATWPVTPARWFQQEFQSHSATSATHLIPQPVTPPFLAFFSSYFRSLRSLDVTPPRLPRIHKTHDETDTPDPWD